MVKKRSILVTLTFWAFCVSLFCFFFVLPIYHNYQESNSILIREEAEEELRVNVEIQTPTPIEYNISEINQEVINTAKKYFKDIDFLNVSIITRDFSVMRSYYYENGREIHMGISNIKNNSNSYKLVLTHEYAHYILYRLRLNWRLGIEVELEDNLHEGLADVYSAFLNREEQARKWGEENELRTYPYTLFINPILEENNFNCLYNVFDENKKVSDYEEILIRLEKFCDVKYD